MPMAASDAAARRMVYPLVLTVCSSYPREMTVTGTYNLRLRDDVGYNHDQAVSISTAANTRGTGNATTAGAPTVRVPSERSHRSSDSRRRKPSCTL